VHEGSRYLTNRNYAGAADKAVNLVGCKSPHHPLPERVVIASGSPTSRPVRDAPSSAIHPCVSPTADELCGSGRSAKRASVTSCVATIELA